MNYRENDFWEIIESCKDFPDEQKAEAILDKLSHLNPNELSEFSKILYNKMAQSYQIDLWGAAYIINGGCSNDGFDYFRSWLIAQGRDIFDAALKNPDSLSDVVDIDKEYEMEELLSFVYGICEERLGAAWKVPWVPYPALANGWDFDDDLETRQHLPRLSAKYSI